jgi:arginyl-tRNA synthetase
MTDPKEKVKTLVEKALAKLGFSADVSVEYPKLLSHGDFSTNVAMILAKEKKTSPLNLASSIVAEIPSDPDIAEATAVAPGFINFRLAPTFLTDCVGRILKEKENFGRGRETGKTIIEYTDPNPFKEFHIGHLMSNTIGEAISRLFEWGGGEVRRACYQGDVGIHVACAVWGLQELGLPPEEATTAEKVAFLGRAYTLGAAEYEKKKSEIEILNKKIYEKSDPTINALYEKGKAWSLEYFESIYKILGTKFDYYFFESEGGVVGKQIVLQNLGKIFEESEKAIIFRGEKYGLHTRVFVNSFGLPTYEAKELALAKIKADKFSYDLSVVVTGNEINEYFKVLQKAMSFIFPELAAKNRHISHGMLRLQSGKMASRKGQVITALSLINATKEEVLKKIDSARFSSEEEKEKAAEIIAVGALKFTILKRAPGHDIIFDMREALSLEGDSGPYLQYTAVRAKGVLEKARAAGISPDPQKISATDLSRLLCRFPEIVKQAGIGPSPQYLAEYLLHLASAFNGFYASKMIVDDSPEAPAKVALAAAVATTMENGLSILGIKTPSKM